MKLHALTILAVLPCLAQFDYALHAKESILIRAPQIQNLNGRVFQIQSDGFVALPSLGRIRASGVLIKTLEKELASRLRQNSSSTPQIAIFVVNVGSPSASP